MFIIKFVFPRKTWDGSQVSDWMRLNALKDCRSTE